MAVSVEHSAIRLSGDCGVDDVEVLIASLSADSALPIDLEAATHLHGAIVQLLLRSGRPIAGKPRDHFIGTWILPAFERA
jgi:hypothetical protein